MVLKTQSHSYLCKITIAMVYLSIYQTYVPLIIVARVYYSIYICIEYLTQTKILWLLFQLWLCHDRMSMKINVLQTMKIQ